MLDQAAQTQLAHGGASGRLLAGPRPVTDTEIDLRDSAQRQADALVELAHRALDTGNCRLKVGNDRRWW